MSRRVYLLGVGLALVALALAFTDWVLSLRPGVTEANFKRISPGMTETEIQTLLGGTAHAKIRHPLVEDQFVCSWWGGAGEAIVTFQHDGRVRLTYWRRSGQEPPSLLTHLRAWLGW